MLCIRSYNLESTNQKDNESILTNNFQNVEAHSFKMENKWVGYRERLRQWEGEKQGAAWNHQTNLVKKILTLKNMHVLHRKKEQLAKRVTPLPLLLLESLHHRTGLAPCYQRRHCLHHPGKQRKLSV